jgi:IS605 OrfB family transposase
MRNVRADALHHATTDLATRYETVVAEDLNVAGMTRNRKLARAIADQGFGQARRMLGYKTTWHGGQATSPDGQPRAAATAGRMPHPSGAGGEPAEELPRPLWPGAERHDAA